MSTDLTKLYSIQSNEKIHLKFDKRRGKLTLALVSGSSPVCVLMSEPFGTEAVL